MIGDVQGEPGAALARELGNAARFKLTDVSRESDIAGAGCTRGSDEFGQLDCMFNNAGFGGVSGNLVDLDLGDSVPQHRRRAVYQLWLPERNTPRAQCGVARRQHHQHRVGRRVARRLRAACVQRDESRRVVAVALGRASNSADNAFASMRSARSSSPPRSLPVHATGATKRGSASSTNSREISGYDDADTARGPRRRHRRNGGCYWPATSRRS